MSDLVGGTKRTTKKTISATWTSTGRNTTLKDGSKRVLYKNPKYPGEYRIRKMRQNRDGKMVAAYVKPPGGKAVGGGFLNNMFDRNLTYFSCTGTTGNDEQECFNTSGNRHGKCVRKSLVPFTSEYNMRVCKW